MAPSWMARAISFIFVGALVGGQDAAHEARSPTSEGEDGGGGREPQPEPLGAAQGEGLEAPLGREHVDRHADSSFLTKIWWATFSPRSRSFPSTRTTMGPSKGCVHAPRDARRAAARGSRGTR